MPTPFSENLRLVIKLLSMSAASLASALQTDKSVVSRWMKGSSQPSAHNLARLSALVATRVEGFKSLDWEREPTSLAEMFGADPKTIPSIRNKMAALPLAIIEQMLAGTRVRGKAYEGFFRSTRPHPRMLNRFLHEYGMIRIDPLGLLRLKMGSAEASVDGWMIPLHGLVYSIASELKSETLMFGIFNGTGASRLDVFDGLTLLPAADLGRAPAATAIICERIGDLSNDREVDDRRCAKIASQNPLAPEGSVPDQIARHLVRDIGPSQVPLGGDLLLTMSLLRTMARGHDYEKEMPASDKVDPA